MGKEAPDDAKTTVTDKQTRKFCGLLSLNDATKMATAVRGELKLQGSHLKELIGRRHNSGSSTDVGQGNRPVIIAAAARAAGLVAGFVKDDLTELRSTWVFKETYMQMQWQRDSYFIGTEYANWSKRRRLREDTKNNARSVDAYLTLMPCDDSLASQQLTKIASEFIPITTVKTALLPIIVKLPQGILYHPTKNAFIHAIRSQQGTLDRLFKLSLLNFLDNPSNRQNIKNSTKGYILQYERE